MSFRFLVVDDSSVVRKVLRKTIAMTDLSVDQLFEAEHGLAALEILSHEWIDLIFLDVNMPVMNGIDFLRRLRANTELSELPVVVVSTEGSSDRIKELEALGIKAFLRKPIAPEDLVANVKNILLGS